MLQAADLVFGYGGTPVVDGVSLQVREGDVVGIIGPNGSGKTTLLRLLAGTRAPLRGTVTLDGAPIASRPRAALARRIAVVPQDTHLAFDYTVLETVLMGRYAHLGPFAMENADDISVAREALDATGVTAFEARRFSTLSGGEKQRVVIAAALAQLASRKSNTDGPPLLLLDEPTAALDLKYQVGVASLLRRLHRERGLTIVVSTHDLSLAAGLCRTIVMLRAGRVLAAGDTAAVLTPERIRSLYDVDVDIVHHGSAGRVVVLPEPGVDAPGPEAGAQLR